MRMKISFEQQKLKLLVILQRDGEAANGALPRLRDYVLKGDDWTSLIRIPELELPGLADVAQERAA